MSMNYGAPMKMPAALEIWRGEEWPIEFVLVHLESIHSAHLDGYSQELITFTVSTNPIWPTGGHFV